MRRRFNRLRLEELESRVLLKAPAEAPPLGPPPAPGPDVVWVDTEAELQNAVVNLQSGQTIVIQKGTYHLTKSLYIGAYGRQLTGVTIRGETEDFNDVVLRGRGMENANYGGVPHGISVYNAQELTIANLSVGDVYFHPIDLQGIQGADRVHIFHVRAFDGGEQIIKSNAGGGGADFCTIQYSLIEYTAGPPVTDHGGGVGYTGGLHAHEVDGWEIRHNVWRNFHTDDSTSFPYNPVVLMWNASRDTLVEGNLFVDCDRAVAFGLVDKAGFDHQGGVIRNNFVYQRPGLFSEARRLGSDAQILVYDSPDTKVYHNTILTNGNSRLSIEVRWATSGVEFKNNLADAPLGARNGGIYTASGNYLGATPSMFVDPAAGDLHLVDNAATRLHVIDRVLAAAAGDWDSDARPSGAAADVGADELRSLDVAPVILDNGDSGFSTSGTWHRSLGEGFQGDIHFSPAGSGDHVATWTVPVSPGLYRVAATWSPHPNRATNSPFTVLAGSTLLAATTINQEAAPNDFSDFGTTWEYIGGVLRVDGTTLTVQLSNLADEYVIADAVRVERLGDLPSGPELMVLDGDRELADGGAAVDFGSRFAGAAVVKTFRVRNVGTAPLSLSPIGGSVPAGFSVVTDIASGTLDPGAETSFTLQFNASTSATGTVTFGNSDADENPFDLGVTGNVVTTQILDNGQSGFSTAGIWYPSIGEGFQGDIRFSPAGSGADVATWTIPVSPGLYRVAATWSAHPNRATNTPFSVFDGPTLLASLTLNQELVPNDLSDAGAAWEFVGDVLRVTSNTLTVRLNNQANEYVVADAIRVERLGDLPSGSEIVVLEGDSEIADGTGLVDFGSTFAGLPIEKTFRVRNIGTSTLSLSQIGAGVPVGFRVVRDLPTNAMLNPGGETSFILRFDAVTSADGMVSFGNSDADESPFNFTVRGSVATTRILDNGQAGFSTIGSWYPSFGEGFQGDIHFSPAGSGADVATWTIPVSPGLYRVAATWSAHPNRATNAPFSVFDGAAPLASETLNQELLPNDLSDAGAAWEWIGDVLHVASDTLTVRLNNQADEYVIADAIRVERVGDLPLAQVFVSTTSEFRSAVAAARPGTAILVRPGIYSGDNFFSNVQGTVERPILIAAADPSQMPIFRGGGEGLHFSDSAYLELRNLIVEGAASNGINIDDAGTYDTPTHHVTLSGLIVRNIGPSGNRDGIKLSGVQQFVVKDSTIASWGDGGSGIDMVGCHDGVIQGNTFRHGDFAGADGVQAKGGSTNIRVLDNRFEHAGLRAVQIGGSTGLQFFRPQPPQGFEAKDITVEGNVIIGSEAAIAFVNVDGALVRFNTIYRPRKWVIRILQETTAPGFVASRNGVFTDNIVAFRSDELSTAVNVGVNTAPETFQFARNWWYSLNDPSRSRPSLPTAEADGVYGVDPQFINAEAGDLHLRPGSPAAKFGAYGQG